MVSAAVPGKWMSYQVMPNNRITTLILWFWEILSCGLSRAPWVNLETTPLLVLENCSGRLQMNILIFIQAYFHPVPFQKSKSVSGYNFGSNHPFWKFLGYNFWKVSFLIFSDMLILNPYPTGKSRVRAVEVVMWHIGKGKSTLAWLD